MKNKNIVINSSTEYYETTVKEVKKLIEEFKNDQNGQKNQQKNLEISGTPLIKMFPHSQEEFSTKQSLYNFFLGKIKDDEENYHVGKNLNIENGTIMWIRYGTELIGEARIIQPTKEINRKGNLNKQLKIDPKSIIIYSEPISYYDFTDLQSVGNNFRAYHNVSYEVFYDLTKKFSDQENIIAHRLERNSNLVDVSSEEETTWFNFKSLKKLFKKKEDELFGGIGKNKYFNVEFAIYEEEDSYWWNLAVYNNYNDEKASIKVMENLKRFLNEISSLKDYEENYSIEDWLDEEKKYVEVIKDKKILELKDNLSWDDVIKEIDKKVQEIEKRCIELLKL